jgi:hypothetical protein
MHQLAAGLQALAQETNERQEREAAVRRTWSGGAEPVPAEVRRWPEGSLGDRFFTGTYLKEARNAPSLATAEIPDAAVIAADPVHWNVATDALPRRPASQGHRPLPQPEPYAVPAATDDPRRVAVVLRKSSMSPVTSPGSSEMGT